MTIKIYREQKGESLKTAILEDVRSVTIDGEFYRFEKYDKAPATVYKRQPPKKGAKKMEKTKLPPICHPRKLARSMAKARTGMNRLSRLDWRKAADDQRKGVRT